MVGFADQGEGRDAGGVEAGGANDGIHGVVGSCAIDEAVGADAGDFSDDEGGVGLAEG